MADISIYRPFVPRPAPDFAEQQARLITLREMMQDAPLKRELLQQDVEAGRQSARATQMKFEEHERALRDDEAMRKILLDTRGDYRKALPKLAGQISPARFLEFQKGVLEAEAKAAAIKKDQVPVEEARNNRGLGVISKLLELPEEQRNADWPHIAQALRSVLPEVLPDMTPEQLEQAIAQPPSRQDLEGLQMHFLTAENVLKFSKDKREKAESDIKVEEGKWGLAARTIGGISNQPDYDAWRAAQDPSIREKLPAMWSPNAVAQVIRRGMTAAEATAADDRDLTRDQQSRFHTDTMTLTREGHKITKRGQDMTDKRARELNEITRDNKPPTEAEARNWGFYTRATQAEASLSKPDANGVSLNDAMAGKGTAAQWFQNNAPNVMQTKQNQLIDQAKRQFIAAYLRRDSGAVISDSEFDDADRTFFPQAGDDKEVLIQKKAARELVIETLRIGAGKTVSRYGNGQQPQQPAAAPPARPALSGKSADDIFNELFPQQRGSNGR